MAGETETIEKRIREIEARIARRGTDQRTETEAGKKTRKTKRRKKTKKKRTERRDLVADHNSKLAVKIVF